MEPSPELGGTTFPAEIMEDIISRIPPEPLTRLKMVNKGWDCLISSRRFGAFKHFEMMNEQNRIGFILQSLFGFCPISYETSIPPNAQQNQRIIVNPSPNVYFLACCKGLVLLCNQEDQIFICNLVNGEALLLPQTKIRFPKDATSASAIYGMGYVPENNDYKVVRVTLFNSVVFKASVHCFSTYTKRWRYICEFPYNRPIQTPGIWCGGCINWQITRDLVVDYFASFNCRDETFKTILVPPRILCLRNYGDFGAISDDKLVAFSRIAESFEEYELWILQDYDNHESWMKFEFDVEYLIPEDRFIVGIQPLRMLRADGSRILFRLEPFGQFVEYCSHEKQFYRINGPEWEEDCCSVFPFVQSIIRPSRL